MSNKQSASLELQFNVMEDNNKKSGVFTWNERSNLGNIYDRYYDALENARGMGIINAVQVFEEMIETEPEFLEAYVGRGWISWNLCNYGEALGIYKEGLEIAEHAIKNSTGKKTFNGTIEWEFIDNRAFLRLLDGISQCYEKMQWYEEVEKFQKKILKYNLNDNQGVRYSHIRCLLLMGKYKNVLSLCKKYKDDTSVEIKYGKVLAYFLMDDEKKAREALKEAIAVSLIVAYEIVKPFHMTINTFMEDEIASNEQKEAFFYWDTTRMFWQQQKLINLVKHEIESQLQS